MEAVNDNEENATVFVKNLSRDTTDKDLEDHFAKIGPIKRAFAVHRKDNVFTGNGYVQFILPEDAQSSISTLNNSELNGNKITVMMAITLEQKKELLKKRKDKYLQIKETKSKIEQLPEATKTLVLFELPTNTTILDIQKKFTSYGKIDIQYPSKIPFYNKEVGLVTLIDSKVNIKVIEHTMDKRRWLGSKIFVRRLSQLVMNITQRNKCRLIVRNIPFTTVENDLFTLFNRYGPLSEVKIPVKKNGKSPGYAFIQYLCLKDAQFGMKKVNGQELNGREIAVDFCVDKDEYAKLNSNSPDNSKSQKMETKDDEEDDDEDDDEDDEEEGEEDEDDDEEEGEEEGEEDDDDDEEEGDEDKSLESDGEEGEEKNGDDNKNEENKENDQIKEKKIVGDADEGLTVFIKNLSVDTTSKDIFNCFKQFGEIVYIKLVQNPETHINKGTAFVKFRNLDSVNKAVEKGAFRDGDREVREGTLKDPNRIIIRNKYVIVNRALTRNDLTKEITERKNSTVKDKRNLYLFEEGQIDQNNPSFDQLPKIDQERRLNSIQSNKKKLLNPNFFISPFILTIMNLGNHVHNKLLRQECLGAVKYGIQHHVVDINQVHPNYRPSTDSINNVVIKQARIVRNVDNIKANSNNKKVEYKSMGFAFVEFQEHYHALTALRVLNNNSKYWWLTKSGQNHVQDKKDIPKMCSRLIVSFSIENHKALRLQKFRKERKSINIKEAGEGITERLDSKKRKFAERDNKGGRTGDRKRFKPNPKQTDRSQSNSKRFKPNNSPGSRSNSNPRFKRGNQSGDRNSSNPKRFKPKRQQSRQKH